MAECAKSLLTGIQSSCAAIKKVGGLDKRIYLGSIYDLASATFGAAGINSVLTMVFKADKGLVQYIGRAFKNSTGSEIEVGENRNLRNQSVNLAIYYETADELGTLDDLIDQEGVFAITETNAGQLEVFGLNKVNFDAFGLKVSALTGSSGVALQDSTAFAVTLSGGHTNLQLLYKPAVALATSIAELDGLSISPEPEA